MGLDMYLNEVELKEVGYWRKANAIHNWFVQNCQNGVDECQHTIVTGAKLIDLLNACTTVLEAKRTGDNAEEVARLHLPPTPGFFFGPTGIGDYYYECLEHTVAMIVKLQNEPLGDHYSFEYKLFMYQSSW